MQLVGQNPMAQQIQAAMMAHINEHIAFEYRKQIEEQLGVNLPTPDSDLPEEYEVEVSRMAALAAQKLFQKNQAEAAQQQAQQAAQDPIVQMQQAELQLKAQELQRKQQKDILDAAAKADALRLEEFRIKQQAETAGLNAGIKAAKDKAELAIKGFEMGQSAAQSVREMQAENVAEKPQKNQK